MQSSSSLFKKSTGFTLIELLVVIVIIGLLASTVVISVNSARSKARDTKRITDLRVVRLALESFYDLNNRYPSSADGNCSYTNSFLAGGCLQVLVLDGFIFALPSDPSAGNQYYYDNWCAVPPGVSDQYFRMWAAGELNHDGMAQNWWTDNTIGETTCQDPS